MEVRSVSETDMYWFICFDDRYIRIQRKYPLEAVHPQLNDDEEIICALCKLVLDKPENV